MIYWRACIKARNNTCHVEIGPWVRERLTSLFTTYSNKRNSSRSSSCFKKWKERQSGGEKVKGLLYLRVTCDDRRNGRTGFSYSRNFAKCHGRELYSPRLCSARPEKWVQFPDRSFGRRQPQSTPSKTYTRTRDALTYLTRISSVSRPAQSSPSPLPFTPLHLLSISHIAE